MEIFSATYLEEIQILQVGWAPHHTPEHLMIPENIILFFQPPYTPEVNFLERLGEHLKSFLKWMNFETPDELRHEVSQTLATFSRDTIGSLTGWDFILNALSLSVI